MCSKLVSVFRQSSPQSMACGDVVRDIREDVDQAASQVSTLGGGAQSLLEMEVLHGASTWPVGTRWRHSSIEAKLHGL